MSIGNHGTKLKDCCEADLKSKIGFNNLHNEEKLDKNKFIKCKNCSTVIWYKEEKDDISLSYYEDGPFITYNDILSYRTNVK